MDRMQPSYGPPNRDDDDVFFGARSRSDAGSRRWRQEGLFFAARPVLARTRRFLDWRACKPKVGLRTSSHTAVRLRCELAINPFLDDGCPRAQKGNGCPRAQRARACCQEPAGRSAAPARVQREHDQTRYSHLRPRAHPRVRGGSAASFLSLVGPARVSLASPARVNGVTALLLRRRRQRVLTALVRRRRASAS